MHVIGTAGHVDHGKSALVRALTGTDPDRWAEERLRGMTLDLGFARLRYDDGVEAGIVDVPGHERFLHNMLAGAAGMELLLLVVAANEGPRPQTFEHLSILQYLNVRETIVVLSKADAVDDSELEHVGQSVRESLGGSIAEGARTIAVSARSGRGLGALSSAIHDALIALPPRAPDAPPYLPVDRVFALPGHGTIVTGTLMQGRIAVGDSLMLSPVGRRVRARSLQVFGERREFVEAGARVAVNVPGTDVAEIARGAVLASAQFEPRRDFEVRFHPLAPALGSFKRRTPVRAHIGSAEILGTLTFRAIPRTAQEQTAHLTLRAPTVAVPGGTFVVRGVTPKTVLGGGSIVGAANAAPQDSEGTDEQRAILGALTAAGLSGTTPAAAGALANLREERAAELLAALVDDGRALVLAKPAAYVSAELARGLVDGAIAYMRARQAEAPWAMGATSLALARSLGVAEHALVRVLSAFVGDGELLYRSGYYATADFIPELSAGQRAFFDGAFPHVPSPPFLPVSLTDLRAAMKSAGIAGLAEAFEMLLATGALVKVGDELYRGAQIAAIRGALETKLVREGQITMAAFRDLVQTSRKYAVPLLEFFDGAGVTLRSGDVRTLRGAVAETARAPKV